MEASFIKDAEQPHSQFGIVKDNQASMNGDGQQQHWNWIDFVPLMGKALLPALKNLHAEVQQAYRANSSLK